MTPQPIVIREDYRGAGKLEGQIAVITGGDSGIGRSVAVHFAREGANVAIIYLEEDLDASQTQEMVKQEARRCITIGGDVSDPEFCSHALRQEEEKLGCLTILVNNAAEQHPVASISEVSPEQLGRTFRTNLFSYSRGFIQMEASS